MAFLPICRAKKEPYKPSVIFFSEQLVRDLIAEINKFRRLHQSSDLTLSEELNNVASQWAQKIANEGIEKIDPNSTYGQLVCSHNAGGNIAKACAVKWYGAVKFFDWADPKLTIKASPFTQMVWKNNSAVGVGIAKGGGKPSAFKRQNVGGKEYIVVLFDPGQNDEGNIKANVLPATGELYFWFSKIGMVMTHFKFIYSITGCNGV